MIEYPKIETLYNRDPKTFKVTDELRMAEFGLVPQWHVTEKIHGTNIRVEWDGEVVKYAGRTSEKVEEIQGGILPILVNVFTPATLTEVFGCLGDEKNPSSFPLVTLYGEGCGPGIQKGGGNYAKQKAFVLFDVLVGKYWLEPEDITDVATKFGIQEAPHLGMMTLDEIRYLCAAGLRSQLALKNGNEAYHGAEGVVCRTVPGLMTRYGTRLVFKLKVEDFPQPARVAQGTERSATNAEVVGSIPTSGAISAAT